MNFKRAGIDNKCHGSLEQGDHSWVGQPGRRTFLKCIARQARRGKIIQNNVFPQVAPIVISSLHLGLKNNDLQIYVLTGPFHFTQKSSISPQM